MNRIQTFNNGDILPSNFLNTFQDQAAPYAPLNGLYIGDRAMNSSNGTVINLNGLYLATIGTNYGFAGATSITPAGLVANTWYYLYTYISAGSVLYDYGTVAGGYAPDALLFQKANDATRRYLGCFATNASSAILPFRMTRGHYVYRVSAITTGTFTALSGGTAAAWATVNVALLVPPHGRLATLGLRLSPNTSGTGTSSLQVRTKGDTASAQSLLAANYAGLTNNAALTLEMETDASQLIEYQVGGTPAGGSIDVLGFTE